MTTPAAPEPGAGSVLGDRYHLDALIARGGMATVHLATDERLDRHVAVKLLDPALAGDSAFVDRFTLEARSAARLSDPGIVQVFDQGVNNGTPYLVMELVPGGTLRELLDERGPMPPYAAAAVLRPVLGALREAHAAGLVHRDIKPENILISTSGNVKLADFGLVRAISESRATSKSVVMGTAAYLSPEQISGKDTDGRSDLYSLGVLAYEMLTGSPPFSGDSSVSIAYQRLNADVPAPSRHPRGPSDALDEFILDATRREAGHRFADAREMQRSLDATAAEHNFPPYVVPAPEHSAWAEARRAAAERTGPGTESEFDVADRESGENQRLPGAAAAAAAGGAAAGGAMPTRVETRTDMPPVGGAERAPAAGGNPHPAGAPKAVARQDAGPGQATAVAPARRDDPGLRPRRRTGCVWFAVITVIALLLGVGGWWLGSGRFATIPNVAGMSVGEATSALDEAGLSAASQDTYSNVVPESLLVGTEPPAGESVPRGDVVDMLVSQGQPAVPELGARRDVPAVTAQLEERTLVAEEGGAEYSDTVSEGDVISLSPTPGTTVDVGSTVEYTVSGGPAPVALPDVNGLLADEARTVLSAAGFTVSEEVLEFDPEVEEGHAIGTDPPLGEEAPRGSDIVLRVSNALDVPDVEGLPVAEAVRELEDAGLTVVRSEPVTHQDIRAGHVASTEPSGESRVDPANPVVRLTPSDSVRVPLVLGSRVSAAESTLRDAGLEPMVDTGSSGVIYGQVPLPGRVVAEGTEVELDALG